MSSFTTKCKRFGISSGMVSLPFLSCFKGRLMLSYTEYDCCVQNCKRYILCQMREPTRQSCPDPHRKKKQAGHRRQRYPRDRVGGNARRLPVNRIALANLPPMCTTSDQRNVVIVLVPITGQRSKGLRIDVLSAPLCSGCHLASVQVYLSGWPYLRVR